MAVPIFLRPSITALDSTVARLRVRTLADAVSKLSEEDAAVELASIFIVRTATTGRNLGRETELFKEFSRLFSFVSAESEAEDA